MPPTRRTLLQASAIGLAGSIAGCAGASENRQETETTTETAGGGDGETGQSGLPFTVAVTTHPDHGVILTDSEGMVLYLFTEGEKGESVCYDDCAEAWPPLTVEESPTIPEGLPGEFDTIERDDGSMQVTYKGWPLYYWQGDEEPGDATGHGVSDVWFVVNPSCPGTAVDTGTTAEPTTAPETTMESGGDGGDGDGGDGDGGDGDGPGY
jgi:predicted lipoprotein with Yx(FWY)xxD motif